MTNHQANPTAEAPLLFAITEAAEILGIGRTNVYSLINAGEHRSVKIGGRRLIPRSAIQDFVNRLLQAEQ